MKRQCATKFKPEALRVVVLRFIEREDVQSGYLGACSSSPQWLVKQRFPTELVEPLVEDAYGGNVGVLELLRTIAGIFNADTARAEQFGLARKRCCRQLAASIKAAIPAMENG